MTFVQVVETLVNVTNNSPSWDYPHLDDQTTQTTETPGFKPLTIKGHAVNYQLASLVDLEFIQVVGMYGEMCSDHYRGKM